MDKTGLIQKLNSLSFTATEAQLEIAIQALTRKNERRELLTSKASAELCGLHRETLLRYSRAGLITPVRVGRRKLRFDKREILAIANGESEVK